VPTLFTRIIDGELPGRFVWRDDRVVAFLTIAPLAPGHTLVVPVEEVEHWIDVPADLHAHLWGVAQAIGHAINEEFTPVKVGVLVIGEEVPHTHVHLVPFRTLAETSITNADQNPDPAGLDAALARLRAKLRELGHGEHVPDD
jgi:histidine triad (HIT) family protein